MNVDTKINTKQLNVLLNNTLREFIHEQNEITTTHLNDVLQTLYELNEITLTSSNLYMLLYLKNTHCLMCNNILIDKYLEQVFYKMFYYCAYIEHDENVNQCAQLIYKQMNDMSSSSIYE